MASPEKKDALISPRQLSDYMSSEYDTSEDEQSRLTQEQYTKDDPTLSFFSQPHTISILVAMLLFGLYLALFSPETKTLEDAVKWGITAAAVVFIIMGTVLLKDGPFSRPHPVVWRAVLATTILYELFLVFLLFLEVDDARQFFKFFNPSLGEPLPERSYAEHCEFTFENVVGGSDEFVAAHVIGWWAKTMVMRDIWLTWILSVMFEIMEYSLEHQLPNFAECFALDTRVLTNHGFLTRDQLRLYLAQGIVVLFACYDTKSKTLVYRSGKLVDVPNREKKLLSFTSAPEAPRWSSDSDCYGETIEKGKKRKQRNLTSKAESSELESTHLSLRVTGNHDMYVQRGQNPPSKVKASELQSPPHCDESLRFFVSAVAGVAANASSVAELSAAMRTLGLEGTAQIEAFLGLYGFWLGDGSMGSDCLLFRQPKSGHAAWLRDQMRACGLADDELQISKATGGDVAISVLRPSWFAVFEQEYSLKPGTAPEKWFFRWVLSCLNQVQSQLLLAGLHRAGHSRSTGENKIFTSSVKFREEIVVLALHAGFSAYFTLAREKGGYSKKHGGSAVISPKEVEAAGPSWAVCWSENAGRVPSMKSQEIVEEPYDGELWCVTVDHADHLIVAQRAHMTPDGTATKASRPVIVGQCWWDHWLLDVLICNWLGIYMGMKTLKYLETKTYDWRGWNKIPSKKAKAKRALAQFTPESWTVFEWGATKNLKRWLAVIAILVIFLQVELNSFYLKFILWFPPTEPLNSYRLLLHFAAGIVGMREAYRYLVDSKCKRLGSQCWMCFAIIQTETLLCIKWGKGMFPAPAPPHVVWGWAIFLSLLALFTVVRFSPLKRFLGVRSSAKPKAS